MQMLEFVLENSIADTPALFQAVVWRRTVKQPLFYHTMLLNSLANIYHAPQSVNILF